MIYRTINEGRKAGHLNPTSEPRFPHSLLRAYEPPLSALFILNFKNYQFLQSLNKNLEVDD